MTDRPETRERTSAPRRVAGALVATTLVAAILIGSAPPAAAAPSLVRQIHLHLVGPPAPDPAGIAYMPGPDRLMVADSEVEEMTIYQGVNLWQVTRTGSAPSYTTVTDTGTTYPAFTPEPTGLGYIQASNTLLISSDSGQRLFFDRPGADGRFGTSDDLITTYNLQSLYGVTDAEDVAFDSTTGHVWIGGGDVGVIFDVDPVNGVFGDGNDVATSHDMRQYGGNDAEGIDIDPTRDTVVVADRASRRLIEVTKTGALVQTIDVRSFPGVVSPADVAVAPSSHDPGSWSYYVADRGVDNNNDPNENDGLIHEITMGDAPVPPPGGGGGAGAPVVVNPGAQDGAEGATVNLQVSATDPDGDTLTYSATGLPPGLSINPSTGRITGTVAAGASAGSPHASTVSASDGTASDTEAFTWTVTAGDGAPAAPTGLRVRRETVGLVLDWADGPEVDLAGYNVYRTGAAAPGDPEPLNASPLSSSTFVDTGVLPGESVGYSVTAVDATGNESDPATANGTRGTIVFRDASARSAMAATIRISRPRGVEAGDVLLASISTASVPDEVRAPAGWEHLGSTTNGDGLAQFLFWKRARATEPATYRWRLGHRMAVAGVVVAYGGSFATTPVQTWAGSANPSSQAVRAPSIRATVPSEVLVGFFGIAARAFIDAPAGMFEHAEARLRGLTISTSDDVLRRAAASRIRAALASRSAPNIGQVVALVPAS